MIKSKKVRLNLHLELKQSKKIKRIAKRESTNVSQLLRRIINNLEE